jgi:hypothetical protein
VSLLDNVFSLIDMRSFSNLWFWIGLAVMWSSLSHFVLGVPFDLVVRAKRKGGQDAADLDVLSHVQVRRRLNVSQVAGPWIVALGSAALTTLALLGFVYGLEFSQAVFLLFFPLTLTGLLTQRTAGIIAQDWLTGPELWRALTRLRFSIQLIGVTAIFITTMWGMWQNLNIGALGN